MIRSPVTHDSRLLHWDGTHWQAVHHPVTSQLFDVIAVDGDEAWAVGTSNPGTAILHWDGTSWTSVPAPYRGVGGKLNSIASVTTGDLWSAGVFYRDDDFELRTLALQAPSTTQGQVIGTTNYGQAVISWFGKVSGSTTADVSGNFNIPGLPAGRYTVTAADPYGGCVPASGQVRIVAAQTTSVDLELDC